jgi:hypothetical protein
MDAIYVYKEPKCEQCKCGKYNCKYSSYRKGRYAHLNIFQGMCGTARRNVTKVRAISSENKMLKYSGKTVSSYSSE